MGGDTRTRTQEAQTPRSAGQGRYRGMPHCGVSGSCSCTSDQIVGLFCQVRNDAGPMGQGCPLNKTKAFSPCCRCQLQAASAHHWPPRLRARSRYACEPGVIPPLYAAMMCQSTSRCTWVRFRKNKNLRKSRNRGEGKGNTRFTLPYIYILKG